VEKPRVKEKQMKKATRRKEMKPTKTMTSKRESERKLEKKRK